MRLTAALMLWCVLGGQTYPPTHPRTGTRALIDNRVGHVVFLPADTVHTDEPIGSASKATIFELK